MQEGAKTSVVFPKPAGAEMSVTPGGARLRRCQRLQKGQSTSLKKTGMTTFVIPAIYSLVVWQSLSFDFRPITLRHQVSLILLFRQPVDPDQSSWF
jgi:hypothetical protein